MRPFTLRFFCAISIVLLVGCQGQGTTFTQADLDDAEAGVQATLEEFWSAWGAADFEEGMAYYSDNPGMSFITDGNVWESKTAAEEAWRPFFESLDHQVLNITRTHLNALTPEVVQVTQTGRYTQYSRTGEASPEMDFTGSFIWVKESGDWKAVAFHNSVANPTPSTLRSVHLVDFPTAADEAAYIQALATLNDAIQTAGYPGNGYELWKIGETQDPEATPIGFSYVMEGSWTDQETYDLIHELDAYQNFGQETLDLFERIAAGQRYTRYVRVPLGGPGEG